MKRWLVVGLAAAGLVGTVGVVGSAVSAGAASAPGVAPDKTQPATSAAPGAGGSPTMPPSSVPPLGTASLPPTVPPTSLWIATSPPSTIPPPITVATTAPVSVPVTAPPTAPVTGPTVAPTASFDGLAWMSEVYATLAGSDPFALLDLAQRTTVRNTAAEAFTVYLLGVHIADQLDGGRPMPAYTVTPNGKSVQVCADATDCTLYGDFVAPTGLLETFSVNGQPLAASATFREAGVESVSVDVAICIVQTDTSLGCVVLLQSEGAAAAISWEQAVFTALDGRQFGLDAARSVFTPSVPDGGFGSARLVFPGAPVEGDLAVPVVSGVSGATNTLTLPLQSL